MKPRPMTVDHSYARHPPVVGRPALACRRCAAMLWLVVMLAASARPARAQPPPGWLAELDEPFRLYQAGRFHQARAVAEAIARRAADPRLRDEATAVAAMASLRSDARDDRLAGRRMLLRVAADAPELTRRPEVRLALGIGLRGLYETAAAIQELHAAVQEFERRGRRDRELEALVALAQTWAVHGEWEVPLPGIVETIPADRSARERLRRERIEECRRRAARLPGGDPYVARIDLILAERLLRSDRTRAEGIRRLETLARSLEMTDAVAQACLRLSEVYESQQRWDEAVQLLDRVRRSGVQAADEAQRRYAALTEPQIEVTAPESLVGGEVLRARLRVRNVQRVQVEVRRVDLAELLARDHGHILEARLPEAGSRVAHGTWTAPPDAGRRWWQIDLAGESWRLPIGSCALIVRGRDARGRVASARRLLIVSDLSAAVWMGTRQAALCSRWRSSGSLAHEPVTAEFWTTGAFVPKRIELADGTALFDLPGDLRALRAARFNVLVRSGRHVALLRGTTTAAQRSRQRPPRVALTFAPRQPRAGGLVQVFGVQLDPSPTPTTGASLRVGLRDAEQRLISEGDAARHGGTFSASLWIPRDMRSTSLRLHVRLGSQTLPIAGGPVFVPITAADVPAWSVALDVPVRLRPQDRALHGVLAARYPWGVPVADGRAHLTFRALALPAPGRAGLRLGGPVSEDRGRLDASGTYEFALPVERLYDHRPPIGLSLTGGVTGFDGRHVDTLRDLLVADGPHVAWIDLSPDPPRVGQPVQLAVAWFDPTGRLGTRSVRLSVRDPAGRVLELPLRAASDALHSEPWRPAQAGPHEIVARFGDGPDAWTVRRIVTVEGRPHTACVELVSAIRAADRPVVRVRLLSATAGRAVLLIADREPRWIRDVPLKAGEQKLELPWPPSAGPTAKLILARWDDQGGLEVLADRPIERAGSAVLAVHAPAEAAAGSVVAAELRTVGGTLPEDAVLIARLTDAADTLAVSWVPGVRRTDDETSPRIELVDTRHASARSVATGRLPIGWYDVLYRGTSDWIDLLDAPTTRRLRIPLPVRPGLWTLSLWAVHDGWIVAGAQRRIDTRQVPRAEMTLPEFWSPGDRVRSAVTLVNPLDEPVEVSLRVQPGRRLAVEPGLLTRGTRVRLAAGERRLLPLTVEAVASGRGLLRWALAAGPRNGRWRTPVRVLPDVAQSSAGAPIRIERRVYIIRVEPPQVTDEPEPQPVEPAANWTRALLRETDRVLPGTRLLVSDRWTVRRELRDLKIVQHVPPIATTCRLTSKESQARTELVEPAVRTLQTLEWRLENLAAGQHVHEFVIAVTSGGVARLRPPIVEQSGRPVPIAIDPPQVLLHASAGSPQP